MNKAFDVIIKDGLFFDGLGNPPAIRHLGLKDGKIAAVSASPLPRSDGTAIVDAAARWVAPGFIDMHTHYDAELEFAPALSESLRHGVTTAVMGNCSLGLTPGTPEVLSDIFCRVEAIPYEIVRPMLEKKQTWKSIDDYFEHLESLPLGPNIASFLGHSSLRAHVMGVHRSLDPKAKPTADEIATMEKMLGEALGLGYLGLSIQTSPWDKMGGSRDYRSRPLPSYFASWSEYRRLIRILREEGAILQAVPNLTTRVNVLLFMLESSALFRKKLKTTVLSMMDVRSDRTVYKVIGVLSRFFNLFLGADFKWQSLPEVFDLWADGFDLVVFEEFGAGADVLHLQDAASRSRLLREPSYRKRFKSQWRNRLLPKAFHRNLGCSEVLDCPDRSLIGKSFADIAGEKGMDAEDLFLDLMAEYGEKLRWFTVMGNDREGPLREILAHPDVLIGFSDAGAHLRNMAHYNFPLRLLRFVKDSSEQGHEFMSVARAIHKCTGEIGRWLGLDAGVLEVGKRADVVVIDPLHLTKRVDEIAEARLEGVDPFVRLVRRNDEAITAVFVNGRQAVSRGQVMPEVGREKGFGRLLRARRRSN